MKRPNHILLAWALLLILRASVLAIGLDRLPLFPAVPDEADLADPAMSLSQGHGWRAPSFAHSPNGEDRFYALFPPLFPLIQAAVFRAFGLSPIALRASSVIASELACLAFLAAMWELRRRETAGDAATLWCGALLILEPTTIVRARLGRMEPLVLLFAGLGLYFALRAERDAKRATTWWLAAAVASGLALATHPAAIALALALAIWGGRRWMAVNAAALLVPLAVYAAAYRERTIEAFQQLVRHTGGAPPPSLNSGEIAVAITSGSFHDVFALGGVALFWIYLSVLAAFIARRRQDVSRLAAMALVPILLFAFFIPGSKSDRVILALPYAMLCLAAMPRPGKLVTVAACIALVAELAICSAYLWDLRRNWTDRAPDRLDAIAQVVPRETRIAAVPEFWYAFLRQNRPLTVIQHRHFAEPNFWIEDPHPFDEYDVVILDSVEWDWAALREKALARHPYGLDCASFHHRFVVFSRMRVEPSDTCRVTFDNPSPKSF